MEVTKSLWLIADLHLGHRGIIKYEGRPFKSIEDMDNFMINQWNSVVKQGDDVLILGDLTYHNQSKTKTIISQLNGNIDLLWGNHDKHNERWYQELGIRKIYRQIRWKDHNSPAQVVFSHEPFIQPFSYPLALNIHGHTHTVGGYIKKCLWTPFNYCVSAELLNYTPVTLGSIIKDIDWEGIRTAFAKIGSIWSDVD